MSPDYKNQIDTLQKKVPGIDQVYTAIQELQDDSQTAHKVIWSYYYPLSLMRAGEFFGEDSEEEANQAAFELMEHLVSTAFMQYDEDKAKLSPFYDKVAQNFFINYMERVVLKQPAIFHGHSYDGGEMSLNEAEHEPFLEDYPYDGIEPDFVDALMAGEEAQERVNALKEDLYPAERAVLTLLVQGHTYAEIAEELAKPQTAIYNSIRKIASLIGQ